MAPTRGRRRISGDVEDTLRELYDLGWSPPQIHRKLASEYSADAPTLRTVQRAVNDLTPRDGSETWSLRDADPATAPMILGALAAVTRFTDGRVNKITKREAAWIAKIRSVAPVTGPHFAYEIAREYMRIEDKSGDASHLDMFLAFAPAVTATPQEAMEVSIVWAKVMSDLWPERTHWLWDYDQEVLAAAGAPPSSKSKRRKSSDFLDAFKAADYNGVVRITPRPWRLSIGRAIWKRGLARQ